MIRRARPLFLLAILGISGYLAYTYRLRMEEQRRNAPPVPKALPLDLNATASDWHWEKSTGDGPAVSVRARNFRQIKEPSQFELEKVELKIYRKDGKTFDHILSDRAVFDVAEKFLYSEGEADITMGVEEGEEPKAHRIVRIKSSGIRFDSGTGKAETEREATFQMERGEGKAVGAVYDPATKELLLKSKAQVTWYDRGPQPRPMKVESDQIVYKEVESKVLLTPWSRLTRGNMVLEGQAADVTLGEEGSIRKVVTTGAKGVDRQPGRLLEYAADELQVALNAKSEVERIEGNRNARLTTTSEDSVTRTAADRVDLEFSAGANDSTLQRVIATGNSTLESKPNPRPGRATPETRVLRSETFDLHMRAGGEEIETLDTPSAAVLEFLPNHPGQRKRRIDGERFHIEYGARNQIERFQVLQAATRTESEPVQGKPLPPSLTWSRDMLAVFAPGSSEMTRLEQWGDFRYQQGDRRAHSERALLEQASNRITLVQKARIWDTTGSTSADQIVLDQGTGDFAADGSVRSSRLPDRRNAGSGMLSGDEPVQASATRMNTFERQARVIYDGSAVLWQGGNRITADRIEIDRGDSSLRAAGNVVSQLLDKKKAAARQPAQTQYTMVRAPAMTYNDKLRLAHYTNGAFLQRPGMDVRAQQIRAYFKEPAKPQPKEASGVPPPAEDSSLDRAVADGAVTILQAAPDRTRKGASEHAEYYTADERIVLEGGDPVLDDSVRGVTRGRRLTYYANQERLIVDGGPTQPAVSRIRRK